MLGNTGQDMSGLAGLSSIVTLNDKMLQNSSQLIIAAAFIHETLHATINYNLTINTANNIPNYRYDSSWLNSMNYFFDQNGLPPNFRDHLDMVTTYLNTAVQTLQLYDNNQHTLKECQMAMLFGLNTSDPNATNEEKNRLDLEYLNVQAAYGITSSDLNTFWSTQLNSSNDKLPTSGCN